MSTHDAKLELARSFYKAMQARDWASVRSLLTDHASWNAPGDNALPGLAIGPEAVVERAKLLFSFDVKIELERILVSRESVALWMHNMGRRGALAFDFHVATICMVRNGRIARIETYLADVPGVNALFAHETRADHRNDDHENVGG